MSSEPKQPADAKGAAESEPRARPRANATPGSPPPGSPAPGSPAPGSPAPGGLAPPRATQPASEDDVGFSESAPAAGPGATSPPPAPSSPPSEDDVGFSESAGPPTASKGIARSSIPAASDDEDIGFTDEVGGAKSAAATKPAAPPLAKAAPASGGPPPAKAAPASAGAPPAKAAPASAAVAGDGPAGGSLTSGGPSRLAPDTGSPASGGASRAAPSGRFRKVGSDRMPTLPDQALEPGRAGPRKGGEAPPEAAGRTTGGRLRSSGASPALDPATSRDSQRARARREDPQFEPLRAGSTAGDYRVGDPLPLVAAALDPRGDGLANAFLGERKGREGVLVELILPPAAAAAATARNERLVAIRHDDLEPLHAAGRSRDGAWAAVDARTPLEQVVREKGPLPEKEALLAIRNALRALAALDARGAVHADPSPRHLVKDVAGSVRLGSPALVSAARATLQGGPVAGDPRYAAPEVLDGQEPVVASSVYVLGLTLLHLLSGKHPVVEEDALAALAARASLPGFTPAIEALAPQASPGARAVYARLTAREPERRASPAEAVAEIEALLDQGRVPEVPAARPLPDALPRPLLPRSAALLLALVGCALAVVCALACMRGHVDDPGASFRFEVSTDGK